MKKFLTILLFLFCAGSGFSQFTSTAFTRDTCLNKKFSVIFYVVLDSNYTPGSATQPTIQSMMSALNDAFKNICVSFENCTTIYIPHYRYKGWFGMQTENAVTARWYTPNTINVYMPDTMYTGFGGVTELEGYTHMPTAANLAAPRKDLLVIDKYRATLNNSSLIVHLMGHFFGLPHTHDEINPNIPASPPPPTGILTMEYANGVSPNCQIHGDGFCDTEADNFPQAVMQDGMGTYYVTPIDNFMSYYNSTRVRFTAQQYYFMVRKIITTSRLALN